jgi:hypothetical protein
MAHKSAVGSGQDLLGDFAHERIAPGTQHQDAERRNSCLPLIFRTRIASEDETDPGSQAPVSC